MNTFTAGSCISFGWEIFKKRFWFFVGVTLLAMIAYGIIDSITRSFTGTSSMQMTTSRALINLLMTIIRLAVDMFLGMGFIAFFLKAHDALDQVKLSDIWHPHPFWKYTGASLLTGIIVVIGFILLIVPGIFAMIVFAFTTYLVIDRNLGPIEALKESARLTKGHRWLLLGLFFLVLLINILGAICLLVGLLVTIPVTSMAIIHAYRSLSLKSAEVIAVV
jgi:uncharacterized membrane protein